MAGARNIWNDFRFQHMQASKLRELKAKEDALLAKEEALNAREATLNQKEQQLLLLEQRLKDQCTGSTVSSASLDTLVNNVPSSSTVVSQSNLPHSASMPDLLHPTGGKPSSTNYDAAKIQAYRRRISMGRQTEQMNIDDDEDVAAPVTLDDVPTAPSTSSSTAPPNATATSMPPKPSSMFMPPPPPSSGTNLNNRRGPVPVPVSAKPVSNATAPAFKILCDNTNTNHHPTNDTVVNRVAQQVYGSAPVYEKRQPLQTIKISTGAENAKENIQPAPLAGNNIFKFAGVNKPHGRPLPYDFQVDSEDSSPMKKQRIHSSNDLLNNRYQSNTAVGEYMTHTTDVDTRAKKMFR